MEDKDGDLSDISDPDYKDDDQGDDFDQFVREEDELDPLYED